MRQLNNAYLIRTMSRKKIIMTAALGMLMACPVKGQFTHGTTGLLHMPTADMQPDKTFMMGGSFLSKHATPPRWSYDTYNYYVNITFFPWLEVAYTCTIFDEGIMMNQDRNFSARLRVWKEGWWKAWMPQLVLGVNDGTSAGGGDYLNAGVSGSANGYYSRYYVAVTKHMVDESVGKLGLHMVYLYNKRTENPLNAFGFGLDFRFGMPSESIAQRVLNGLTLIAEAYPGNGRGVARVLDAERGVAIGKYDVNIGACYSMWKERINVYGHLYGCKDFSLGLQFKVVLF